MQYEFKTIDTRIPGNLAKAEALQAKGWEVVNAGTSLWNIMFQRVKPTNRRKTSKRKPRK